MKRSCKISVIKEHLKEASSEDVASFSFSKSKASSLPACLPRNNFKERNKN
jgi:hypothetical protein